MQKRVVGVGTDCGENEYMFELKNFTRFAVNWVKLLVSLFTGYHELIGKSFFYRIEAIYNSLCIQC